MGKLLLLFSSFVLAINVGLIAVPPAQALVPYARTLWDPMLPSVVGDPFKVLEHMPLDVPRDAAGTLALARTDWKETPAAHVISLDVPGFTKGDMKIEVEDNRVLRITGERKSEKEDEGEKWHRAERTASKFWREFRLPANADLDSVHAHLENGVLRITVPKLAEEKKRQPKLVHIAGDSSAGDVKATKVQI
ncbi:22.0 kDa class IV heat shock protein-like [Malania oleifera]|uniref:22.0 kDa class IV heat shock protein-like n=1 Tax=Malania oleifera TaxID=397392 RepID=UPI0025ADA16C|nr:22.0 kDa class IV heat shock protein-like [Malania oleifera]